VLTIANTGIQASKGGDPLFVQAMDDRKDFKQTPQIAVVHNGGCVVSLVVGSVQESSISGFRLKDLRTAVIYRLPQETIFVELDAQQELEYMDVSPKEADEQI
jgi:hypothetical protein